MTIYLLLVDSYGLVSVRRPLWQEVRSGFVYVAGPRQRSLSRVRVRWDSWPCFTLSDLRLPFSSTPTTLRVTVEVFHPASTWVELNSHSRILLYPLGTDHAQKTSHVNPTQQVHWLPGCCLAMVSAQIYRKHVTGPLSAVACRHRGHKENTIPVFLVACMLWALPRNRFTCHRIIISSLYLL
jgi:hypothetical protein